MVETNTEVQTSRKKVLRTKDPKSTCRWLSRGRVGIRVESTAGIVTQTEKKGWRWG